MNSTGFVLSVNGIQVESYVQRDDGTASSDTVLLD